MSALDTESSSPRSALLKVYQVLVECLDPDPVLDKLLESGFPLTTIRDIREERLTSEKNRKLIEAVLKRGDRAYFNFKSILVQCRQELLYTLLESTEKGENTLDLQRVLCEKEREQMKHNSEDKKLYKDFKGEIITYYREHESVIPASPLVDEHSVPIEDLYVLPPMWAYNNPFFGSSKNRTNEDEISENDGQDGQESTISRVFLSGNVRYRKIYITANAGFGKTSLSQKLTMTWCQSHSPMTSLTENYEGDELAAMEYFDLLFLLHLRDYQSESKCNLDDLIMQMVTEKLSRNAQYTKEFIQSILHKTTYLIILDGLDEWVHPGHCARKPEVPHNNHPGTCTVLTTTRDWKIGTVGLSPKDIDRRVEILMLDDETREKLEENAVRILNENKLNLAGKNIADFDKEVESVEIGNIIFIPYILLQLMCLFFGGLPIGKSKCEIYSNITEFTIERGLNKINLPNIHVQSNDNMPVPNCMTQNETCTRYFILLIKVGKLAFYTLFSEKKELSLTFDRRVVSQYMTEQEIEFFLKVGLLCQSKDSGIIAVKRYKVFFQHKSVQEFFSAFYLTSEWQNENVKLTIFKMCSSISRVLEMSNLLVFVCGINPGVYTCISGEFQKNGVVDAISRRQAVSNNLSSIILANEKRSYLMNEYQLMQMRCLQESMRNGNESCPIDLYVWLVGDWQVSLTILKTIIHFNKGHVKSIQLDLFESDYDIILFIQSLDPGVFTFLETLEVILFAEVEFLTDILTESSRTLKLLTLSGYGISLSDISITALTGLTCLQTLQLPEFHMTHSNLKRLYAYISQTTTLTQLNLDGIHCSDHEAQYRDCDVTLDLLRLNRLKMLDLDPIACKELRVNPACIEELEFSPRGEKMTARASATLWQDLRAAPVLSSLSLTKMSACLEMIQTIPTLTELKYLMLQEIDIGDVIPRLLPSMMKLEHVVLRDVTSSYAGWQELFLSVVQLPQSITVELSGITMTYQGWRELLLSVGGLQHSVTVVLESCRGPSLKEWQALVNVIKTTPTLSLLRDLSTHSRGYAWLTLKNKTE